MSRGWLAGVLSLAIVAEAGAADPCQLSARHKFTVLSNNVGIFPAAVTALYPAKLRDKKKEILADEVERAAALAKALREFAGDPDAILLQEIWSPSARDKLIRDLGPKYPHARYPEVEQGDVALQPAGLLICSKFPIERFAFREFTPGTGLDKLSRKGIAGIRLTIAGRPVALFTTHLQAGAKRDPTIRPAQLRECHAFIRELAPDSDHATRILAGDFNIDSTDKRAYAEIFAQLPGARDSHRPGCGLGNRSVRPTENPDKRLDYLVTFDGVEAISQIVDPAGKQIADHLAVFATVSLDTAALDRGGE
ncbi:MAG: endonuclease/exonuclease/phosphatase family protein [Planctomycetaceae bacterium]|nr:endonuclease/exonuclease/phosphatase family protein [Planctomycetaceae bacterium]